MRNIIVLCIAILILLGIVILGNVPDSDFKNTATYETWEQSELFVLDGTYPVWEQKQLYEVTNTH